MTSYWRAVAHLRLNRPQGLAALEECFRSGSVPIGLRGPLRGQLLATTVGSGIDPAAEALARVWLPWRGKTFTETGGANLFTAGGCRLIRLCWPRYADLDRTSGGIGTAFRFETSTGPSAAVESTEVLRIDYREVAENPGWPVRKVLDEVVAVDDGICLGQALLHWKGRLRRAAWFSLTADA